MSDKLTPDELYRITEATAPNHSVEKLVLLDHITAIETERDEAIALIHRFLDRLAELDMCLYCGETWVADAPDTHTPGCLIPEARAWLAKVEKL
jgi:hypothetical protein